MSNNDPNDEVIADRGGPQPRIDAIEDAAMTGDQIAGVLDTALAFNHAFTQVTQGGNGAEKKTK